jgi:5-methylcytosine-specific restriction endonuclease McrA
MSSRVLVLTPWLTPYRVIGWQEAVTLWYLNKVDVLEEYDEEIVSQHVTIRKPAVIRLRRSMYRWKRGVKFNRIGVFTRDNFRCGYCGIRSAMKDLNYDHVIPRVQGGKTTWANIITACIKCNLRKGPRTPDQAGMKLLREPYRPMSLPYSYLQVDRANIPTVWSFYLTPKSIEEDRTKTFLLTA